jgi:hypothetical protein
VVSFPSNPYVLQPLTFSSTGFKFTSEDSSEVTFLLVENYNYDCSSWPSGRLGIFDTYCGLQLLLFIDFCGFAARLKKSFSTYHSFIARLAGIVLLHAVTTSGTLQVRAVERHLRRYC